MKKIFWALAIGIICTVIISCYSENVQADLAHNFVRFHVIANSDSKEDQELKLKVRDRIINETQKMFNNCESIDETKETIKQNIPFICKIAKDEINKYNKEYDIKVTLGVYPFPTKVYGDVVLPAGNYDALRVIIGDGNGKNWWCVLFPPLCFVDASHGVIPEETKQMLKNVLTDEEYELITSTGENEKIPVKIKFKIVEWWQNSRMKIQTVFNEKSS